MGRQHATEYGHGWSSENDGSDVMSVTWAFPAAIVLTSVHAQAGQPKRSRAQESLRKNVSDTYDRGVITTIAWHFSNPVSEGGSDRVLDHLAHVAEFNTGDDVTLLTHPEEISKAKEQLDKEIHIGEILLTHS